MKHHMVITCQLCYKPLPNPKVLPFDFFVICEECVKRVRHK